MSTAPVQHFVLTGFTQDKAYRVFAFDRISDDRTLAKTRTAFVVRADLALIRDYGIHVQDLPLLCRGLLEREDEGAATRALTFGEDEMRVVAKDAAEAVARRKSAPPRRPTMTQNTGAGWRTSPPPE